MSLAMTCTDQFPTKQVATENHWFFLGLPRCVIASQQLLLVEILVLNLWHQNHEQFLLFHSMNLSECKNIFRINLIIKYHHAEENWTTLLFWGGKYNINVWLYSFYAWLFTFSPIIHISFYLKWLCGTFHS